MDRGPVEQAILVGRYAICGEIASGGMATVHHGLFRSETGFARTVAIKRLHAHYAKDREFSAMLRDEARLTARVRHPNVVSTLDVAVVDDEFLLVMDYIHGEALSRLLRAARNSEGSVPRDILSAIFCAALHGLHAAHDATDAGGQPLRIVHRDASPQNIIVGADGIARVLDFGIAKAVGRSQTTRNGELKGKLAYMSPEQLTNEKVDRRTDVYAIGVVLWEALTMQRLFPGDSEGFIVARILEHRIDKPSLVTTNVSRALDAVVMRALAKEPAQRFASAEEMARALEAAVPPAGEAKVAAWVNELVGDALVRRAQMIAGSESVAHELLASAKVFSTSLPEGDPGAAAALGAAAQLGLAAGAAGSAARGGAVTDEADLPTATGVSLAAIPAARLASAKATPPTGRRWLGYAALVLVGAGITLAATATRRGDERPGTTPPASATPSTTATPSDSAPSPSPALSVTTTTAAPTASASAEAPPVASGRRRVAPRAAPRTSAASAPPASSASAKSREQHCDWHNEQGIWVPTNCH